MNPLVPSKTADFRTSCARLRHMPDFIAIMEYLEQRLDAHRTCLVSASPADVQQFQGRAKEVLEIIDQINKTKE